MSIGQRISMLRKQSNLSQEYIAEKLNVTRQAVSKWEQNLSSPDTGNLIKLAELFDTTVEYIATGKMNNATQSNSKGHRRLKLKRKHIIYIVSVLLLFIVIGGATGGILYVRSLPVEWDAAGCSGGYATFIFDKYQEELTEKFFNGAEDKEQITSVEAIRGSQDAQWEDDTIYLQFDIRYEHDIEGTVTQRLNFIGHRTWFDTYDWGGAIIVG